VTGVYEGLITGKFMCHSFLDCMDELLIYFNMVHDKLQTWMIYFIRYKVCMFNLQLYFVEILLNCKLISPQCYCKCRCSIQQSQQQFGCFGKRHDNIEVDTSAVLPNMLCRLSDFF
jgi:hypothetical protein